MHMCFRSIKNTVNRKMKPQLWEHCFSILIRVSGKGVNEISLGGKHRVNKKNLVQECYVASRKAQKLLWEISLLDTLGELLAEMPSKVLKPIAFQ